MTYDLPFFMESHKRIPNAIPSTVAFLMESHKRIPKVVLSTVDFFNGKS